MKFNSFSGCRTHPAQSGTHDGLKASRFLNYGNPTKLVEASNAHESRHDHKQLISPPTSSPSADAHIRKVRTTVFEVSSRSPSPCFSSSANSMAIASAFKEVFVKNEPSYEGGHSSTNNIEQGIVSQGSSTEILAHVRVESPVSLISTPISHVHEIDRESMQPASSTLPSLSPGPSGLQGFSTRLLHEEAHASGQNPNNTGEVYQLPSRSLRARRRISYRVPRRVQSRPSPRPRNPILLPDDVVLDSIETDVEPLFNEEYEVERIVGGGIRTDTGQTVYMVKWVGYEELTIEPAECCINCPEKIAEWKAIPRANDLIKQQFMGEEVRKRREIAEGERRDRRVERMRDEKGRFVSRERQGVLEQEKRHRQGTEIEDSGAERVMIQSGPQPIRPGDVPANHQNTTTTHLQTAIQERVVPQRPEILTSDTQRRPEPILPPPKPSMNSNLSQSAQTQKRDLATLLRQEKYALQPAGSRINRLRQEFLGCEDINPKRVRIISGDGMRVEWVNRW